DGRTPAYTYDLLHTQDVVDTFRFRATAANTAAVRTSYASLGAGHVADSARVGIAPGHVWGSAVASPVRTPARRTEYVSANGVTWGHEVYAGSADEPQQGWFTGAARTYRPREQAAATVGKGVLSTRADGAFDVDGDTLGIDLVPWRDADGNAFRAPGDTRLQVWQDDTAVVDATRTRAELPLPDGGADHRVVLDASHDTPWCSTSTRTRTGSPIRATPGALPGGPCGGPAGAGASGHAAARGPCHWGGPGVVRPPRGAAPGALRVEPRAAAGGTVRQTETRASGVR